MCTVNFDDLKASFDRAPRRGGEGFDNLRNLINSELARYVIRRPERNR